MSGYLRLAVRALLTATAALGLATGCSEERVPTSLPGAHPATWIDPAAVDFHGDVVLAGSAESCKECHGGDFDGGEVGVSCVDCHLQSGTACTACHGGLDNQTGAPPRGLSGVTDDTALVVGAHTVHLEGGELTDGIECASCHNVPVFSLDPEHLGSPADSTTVDSTAEVIWHGFADGGGAAWNRAARTCTDTYCHGNFAGGDSTNIPVWTADNQAGCGSCHDVGGDPATLLWKHEFHVGIAGLDCVECHAAVVDSQLVIRGLALHVNGVIDTLTRDTTLCNTCHGGGATGCTLCHGGTDNQTGAPPEGLEGETATTDLAVGGHSAHVEDGTLADAFDCTACHVKPAAMLDPGHLGADSVAEITWGDISPAPGVSWDRNTAVCANTYCHGNFTGGTAGNAPIWTGSNQAVCGSCHDIGGDPATLGWKHRFHVEVGSLDCVECHAAVVDSQLDIRNLALHVNGVADTLTRDTVVCNACHGGAATACTICHGGVDNQSGAPPTGLEGETATTDLAVGAHTLHLSDGMLADAFDCSACHTRPDSILAAGHLGADSIAEVTWGDISPAPGIAWTRTAGTCANTYCHGNFVGGNSSNRPVWTNVRPGLCGTCHDAGANPSLLGSLHEYHVWTANLTCVDCHFDVTDTLFSIRDITLHVNGVADVRVADTSKCNVCHGDPPGACVACHGGVDNGTGAPPQGLRGQLATTTLAVGAHSAHVEGGALADAFDCIECHVKPANLLALGHLGLDSIAEMTWGGIAPAPGVSWNRGTATCRDTYCHGNFAGGDGGNAPVWTAAGQADCGSCHDVGADPNSLRGRHEKHVVEENLPCQRCHAATTDLTLNIVGRDVHVNGQREVVFSTGQGTFSNGSCSGLGTGCHGTEDWY